MTTEEINNLVTLLNKLKPGVLPEDVFIAIARLIVLPAVEFIPLRITDGKMQVFLTRRSPNDPIWPNKLHTPGTIIRPTDTSLEDAVARLLKDEFEITDTTSVRPIFIGCSVEFNNDRGTGLCIEHLVEFDEVPSTGEYYDIESLPDDFLEFQRDMVQRAVTKFRQLKQIQN